MAVGFRGLAGWFIAGRPDGRRVDADINRNRFFAPF
jgi:hypothetical protein